MQYYEFKQHLEEIDLYLKAGTGEVKSNRQIDFVENAVIKRESYAKRMRMIEKAASECDPFIGNYIFESVTTGKTFSYFEGLGVPCGRTYFYTRYRKFLCILDELRE